MPEENLELVARLNLDVEKANKTISDLEKRLNKMSAIKINIARPDGTLASSQVRVTADISGLNTKTTNLIGKFTNLGSQVLESKKIYTGINKELKLSNTGLNKFNSELLSAITNLKKIANLKVAMKGTSVSSSRIVKAKQREDYSKINSIINSDEFKLKDIRTITTQARTAVPTNYKFSDTFNTKWNQKFDSYNKDAQALHSEYTYKLGEELKTKQLGIDRAKEDNKAKKIVERQYDDAVRKLTEQYRLANKNLQGKYGKTVGQYLNDRELTYVRKNEGINPNFVPNVKSFDTFSSKGMSGIQSFNVPKDFEFSESGKNKRQNLIENYNLTLSRETKAVNDRIKAREQEINESITNTRSKKKQTQLEQDLINYTKKQEQDLANTKKKLKDKYEALILKLSQSERSEYLNRVMGDKRTAERQRIAEERRVVGINPNFSPNIPSYVQTAPTPLQSIQEINVPTDFAFSARGQNTRQNQIESYNLAVAQEVEKTNRLIAIKEQEIRAKIESTRSTRKQTALENELASYKNNQERSLANVQASLRQRYERVSLRLMQSERAEFLTAQASEQRRLALEANTRAVISDTELIRRQMTLRALNLTRFSNAQVSAGQRLESYGDMLLRFSSRMAVYITAPALLLGRSMFDTAMGFQKAKLNIETMTGDIGGTSATLADFQKLAKEKGYDYLQLTGAYSNLVQALPAEQAGNASYLTKSFAKGAIMGGNPEALGLAVYQIGQMVNKTAGYGQDLRAIKDQIPMIGKALMARYGTVDSETIAKMGQTGMQVAQAIADELNKMPERNTNNPVIAMNKFRNQWMQLMNELGTALLDVVSKLTPAVEFLFKLTSRLDSATKSSFVRGALIGVALPVLVGAIGSTIKIFGALLKTVGLVNREFIQVRTTLATFRSVRAGNTPLSDLTESQREGYRISQARRAGFGDIGTAFTGRYNRLNAPNDPFTDFDLSPEQRRTNRRLARGRIGASLGNGFNKLSSSGANIILSASMTPLVENIKNKRIEAEKNSSKNLKTLKAQESALQVTQYALMGSMFGVWGALIGGTIGLITKLTEQAKKADEVFQSRLFKADDLLKEVTAKRDRELDSIISKASNSLQKLRDEASKGEKKATQQHITSVYGKEYGGLYKAYEDYLLSMGDLKKTTDEVINGFKALNNISEAQISNKARRDFMKENPYGFRVKTYSEYIGGLSPEEQAGKRMEYRKMGANLPTGEFNRTFMDALSMMGVQFDNIVDANKKMLDLSPDQRKIFTETLGYIHTRDTKANSKNYLDDYTPSVSKEITAGNFQFVTAKDASTLEKMNASIDEALGKLNKAKAGAGEAYGLLIANQIRQIQEMQDSMLKAYEVIIDAQKENLEKQLDNTISYAEQARDKRLAIERDTLNKLSSMNAEQQQGTSLGAIGFFQKNAEEKPLSYRDFMEGNRLRAQKESTEYTDKQNISKWMGIGNKLTNLTTSANVLDMQSGEYQYNPSNPFGYDNQTNPYYVDYYNNAFANNRQDKQLQSGEIPFPQEMKEIKSVLDGMYSKLTSLESMEIIKKNKGQVYN